MSDDKDSSSLTVDYEFESGSSIDSDDEKISKIELGAKKTLLLNTKTSRLSKHSDAGKSQISVTTNIQNSHYEVTLDPEKSHEENMENLVQFDARKNVKAAGSDMRKSHMAARPDAKTNPNKSRNRLNAKRGKMAVSLDTGKNQKVSLLNKLKCQIDSASDVKSEAPDTQKKPKKVRKNRKKGRSVAKKRCNKALSSGTRKNQNEALLDISKSENEPLLNTMKSQNESISETINQKQTLTDTSNSQNEIVTDTGKNQNELPSDAENNQNEAPSDARMSQNEPLADTCKNQNEAPSDSSRNLQKTSPDSGNDLNETPSDPRKNENEASSDAGQNHDEAIPDNGKGLNMSSSDSENNRTSHTFHGNTDAPYQTFEDLDPKNRIIDKSSEMADGEAKNTEKFENQVDSETSRLDNHSSPISNEMTEPRKRKTKLCGLAFSENHSTCSPSESALEDEVASKRTKSEEANYENIGECGQVQYNHDCAEPESRETVLRGSNRDDSINPTATVSMEVSIDNYNSSEDVKSGANVVEKISLNHPSSVGEDVNSLLPSFDSALRTLTGNDESERQLISSKFITQPADIVEDGNFDSDNDNKLGGDNACIQEEQEDTSESSEDLQMPSPRREQQYVQVSSTSWDDEMPTTRLESNSVACTQINGSLKTEKYISDGELQPTTLEKYAPDGGHGLTTTVDEAGCATSADGFGHNYSVITTPELLVGRSSKCDDISSDQTGYGMEQRPPSTTSTSDPNCYINAGFSQPSFAPSQNISGISLPTPSSGFGTADSYDGDLSSFGRHVHGTGTCIPPTHSSYGVEYSPSARRSEMFGHARPNFSELPSTAHHGGCLNPSYSSTATGNAAVDFYCQNALQPSQWSMTNAVDDRWHRQMMMDANAAYSHGGGTYHSGGGYPSLAAADSRGSENLDLRSSYRASHSVDSSYDMYFGSRTFGYPGSFAPPPSGRQPDYGSPTTPSGSFDLRAIQHQFAADYYSRSSAGVDPVKDYLYAAHRDAMYGRQGDPAFVAPMPPSIGPVPGLERDPYPGGQYLPSSYGFISDPSSSSAAMLRTTTPPSASGRYLVGNYFAPSPSNRHQPPPAPLVPKSDSDDPYRRPVIYNMMHRYF